MNGEDLQRNKDLVRAAIDVLWNGGEPGRAGEFVLANVRRHHERNPDADLHGLDAVRDAVAGLRAAAPDARLEVVRLFAEADRVMVYLSGQGTHEGGAALAWTVTAIVRIADGRIAEVWLIADSLGLLQQLDAVRRFG